MDRIKRLVRGMSLVLGCALVRMGIWAGQRMDRTLLKDTVLEERHEHSLYRWWDGHRKWR